MKKVTTVFSPTPLPHVYHTIELKEDKALNALKRKSEKRREAIPLADKIAIRTGPVPTILQKDYRPKAVTEMIGSKILLPPPSLLPKKEETIHYTAQESTPVKLPPITPFSILSGLRTPLSDTPEPPTFFIMQRPVTIYIKQKNGQSLPRSEAIRMAKEKNIHYALPEDDEDDD